MLLNISTKCPNKNTRQKLLTDSKPSTKVLHVNLLSSPVVSKVILPPPKKNFNGPGLTTMGQLHVTE